MVIFPQFELFYLYNFSRKAENALTFLKNVLQYTYKICSFTAYTQILQFGKGDLLCLTLLIRTHVSAAAHVQTVAPLALSLKKTANTLSMLTNALTAVLAQVLAPLVLPKLTNLKTKNNGFRFGIRYFYSIGNCSNQPRRFGLFGYKKNYDRRAHRMQAIC